MSIERLTSSIEGNDFATMRASTDAAGNDTLNAVRWTGVRWVELNEHSLAAMDNFLTKSSTMQNGLAEWTNNEVNVNNQKNINYTTQSTAIWGQIASLNTQIAALMVPPIVPANVKAAAPLIKMKNELVTKQMEANNNAAEAGAKLGVAQSKYTSLASQASFLAAMSTQRSNMQTMKNMAQSLKMTPTTVEKTLSDVVTKKRLRKWSTKVKNVSEEFFDGTAWTGAVWSIANPPKWVSINPATGEISVSKMRWKNIPEELSFDVRVAAPTTVPLPGWWGFAQATHTKRYTLKIPKPVETATAVDRDWNPIEKKKWWLGRWWRRAKKATAHSAHATASLLGTKPMLTAAVPLSAGYQAVTWAAQAVYNTPKNIANASKESLSSSSYGSVLRPLRLPGNLVKYGARWVWNIFAKVKRGTRDPSMSLMWWARNRTKWGKFAFGNATKQHKSTLGKMFAWKPWASPVAATSAWRSVTMRPNSAPDVAVTATRAA